MSQPAHSQTNLTWFTGWMLAGSLWADPALAAKPLVEPRATKPDSVRALERARADSIRAEQPHMSGGQAFAVGLAATLAPAGFALLVNPPGSNSDIAWEGSLTLGVALGVLAGPAVGLASGGRGDLAARGLTIRGIGYGAAFIGLLAVGSAFENNADGPGITAVAIAGLGGATVSLLSGVHDLAITPSAVGPAKHVSVRPVVDARGRFALRATF